jgi:hypothetical protein
LEEMVDLGLLYQQGGKALQAEDGQRPLTSLRHEIRVPKGRVGI